MPVTAKLSRRFYEALGDDVANELVDWFNMVDSTYRADLRELNQLNFARFDAKVEQRFVEFEARVEKRLDQFEERMSQRFVEMDQRFAERLAERFAEVDSRFASVEGRFTSIEERFASVDRRFAESDAKLEQRLGELRADLIKWMFIFWATTSLSVLGMLKL